MASVSTGTRRSTCADSHLLRHDFWHYLRRRSVFTLEDMATSRRRAITVNDVTGWVFISMCFASGIGTAFMDPGFRIPAWTWVVVFLLSMSAAIASSNDDLRPSGRYALFATGVVLAWVTVFTVENAGLLGTFLVFISAMGVYIIPMRWVAALVGANILVTSLQILSTAERIGGAWQGQFLYVFFYAAIQMGCVLITWSLVREAAARVEIQQKNVQLTASAVILEDATRSNERLRISRELHDLIGHQLTVLNLELEAAKHRARKSDALPHIDQAAAVAKELLTDVRFTVNELRDTGTGSDLREDLTRIADAAPGLSVDLDIYDDVIVSDEQSLLLIRATQEIITNTLKHSDADRVSIRINKHDDNVVLTAFDNARHSPTNYVSGHGLDGLRERVDMMNGSIDIDPRNGFRVQLTLPTDNTHLHTSVLTGQTDRGHD